MTPDSLDPARLARRMRAAADRIRGALLIEGVAQFRAIPCARLAQGLAIGLVATADATGQADLIDAEPDDPRRFPWGPRLDGARVRRRHLTEAEWRQVLDEVIILRDGAGELARRFEADHPRLADLWADRIAPLVADVEVLVTECRSGRKIPA